MPETKVLVGSVPSRTLQRVLPCLASNPWHHLGRISPGAVVASSGHATSKRRNAGHTVPQTYGQFRQISQDRQTAVPRPFTTDHGV